jgi:hypothetical protein
MSDTPRTDAAETKHEFDADRWVKSDFARELERELAAAIKQRDEARRDLCVSEAIVLLHEANPNALISYGESRRIAREIAVERGWDCFDAKEGQP